MTAAAYVGEKTPRSLVTKRPVENVTERATRALFPSLSWPFTGVCLIPYCNSSSPAICAFPPAQVAILLKPLTQNFSPGENFENKIYHFRR